MVFAVRQLLASLRTVGRGEIPRHEVRVYLTRRYESSHAWARASRRLRDARAEEYLEDLQRRFAPHALPFAVVATCLNEAHSIESWLEALADQSVRPQQVVLCDGGSTDGTAERAVAWNLRNTSERRLPLQIIPLPGANIAQGRNAAIEEAQAPLLLFSDVGAPPDRTWAEYLLLPFVANPSLTAVMGFYRYDPATPFRSTVLRLITPRLDDIDPAVFLPSARSLACLRSACLEVGGFPEYLTFAGEDTLFDLALKERFSQFAFVPEATVKWVPSQKLFHTIVNYAVGDAEGGKLFWSHYTWLLRSAGRVILLMLLGTVSLFVALRGTWFALLPTIAFFALSYPAVMTIVRRYLPSAADRSIESRITRVFATLFVASAQTLGFLRGLSRRSEVEARRLKIGVVDSGAGYGMSCNER